MDTPLGFSEGGATVYRRDDGTHFTVDPFLGGALDCVAPGQTVPARTTGYNGIETVTNFVAGPCPPLVAALSSSTPNAATLGADYINTRLQILNYLPSTPFGTATEDRIIAAANEGPGLLALLEAQTPETLEALKAQQNAVAQAQVTAFETATGIRYDPDGYAKNRDSNDFDVLGAFKLASSFVANPVGTYVQAALQGVAAGAADDARPISNALERYDQYENSQFYQSRNQGFYDAFNDTARSNLMTFLGSNNLFGVPSYSPYSGFSPVFDDQPIYGGTASPPITETGGGVLDTVLSALPTIIRGAVQLAPTGLLGGSLQRAFTPQSPSGGVTPTAMAAPAAGTGGTMTYSLNNALQYALMAYANAQGQASANMGGPDGVTVQMGGSMTYADAPSQNVQWPVAGGCGQPRTRYVDMMSAPGLFNVGCRGLTSVSQVVLQNPNGARDLYMKVGRIIAPSQKALQRAARKLAKQAHCTVQIGGGRRARRRVYRRRRPR